MIWLWKEASAWLGRVVDDVLPGHCTGPVQLVAGLTLMGVVALAFIGAALLSPVLGPLALLYYFWKHRPR